MRITRIYIKNYKSIKEIDIPLSDKVNVFIGENSVGKSNIFSAIDWLLGAIYPSLNNVSHEDFYRGDMSSHLIIRIYFDDAPFPWALTSEHGQTLKHLEEGCIPGRKTQTPRC